MEEDNDGGRKSRFDALLEVARIAREEVESQEKGRTLRRNIKEISFRMIKDTKSAAEICGRCKRSEIPKKPFQLQHSDVIFHQQKKDGGDPISCLNFLDNLSSKSSDAATSSTSEEITMPKSKKAKKCISEEPIMAIPESIYFEDLRLIFRNPSPSSSNGARNKKFGDMKSFPENIGFVFKNQLSSERVRKKKVDLVGEMKPMPKNFRGTFKMPPSSKRVKNKKVGLEGEIKPLPEIFKNKIKALGGPSSESSITFVFQKELTATDVNANHGRLLIPFKQLKDHSFLTESEKDILGKRYDQNRTEEGNNNDHNKDKGAVKMIPAIFLDPDCVEGQMNVTRWDMGKGVGKVSRYYCLLTHWRKVVEQNELKEKDSIQLWGFRKGSELGLALVVVKV